MSTEGRSPTLGLQWPPARGSQAARALETRPGLFVQLSALASAPPLGPGLSGVKIPSPAPTTGQ